MTDRPPHPALRFDYHRSVAPMLWALIALSVCELLLVHLLVASLWSGWIALALTGVTVAGIGWLLAQTRAFRRLPVLVERDAVVMRAGTIRSVTVPRSDIAAVRGEIAAAEAKSRDVLKLSLLAHPNIVLHLARPIVSGRRAIRAVAHRLDDPAGFLTAVAR